MRRHTTARRKRDGRKRRRHIVVLSEPVTPGDAYLNKGAVARRLGVKPKTVAEWANQGKLPAYRIGSYLRFKWAEIEQHLAATCRVRGKDGTDGANGNEGVTRPLTTNNRLSTLNQAPTTNHATHCIRH